MPGWVQLAGSRFCKAPSPAKKAPVSRTTSPYCHGLPDSYQVLPPLLTSNLGTSPPRLKVVAEIKMIFSSPVLSRKLQIPYWRTGLGFTCWAHMLRRCVWQRVVFTPRTVSSSLPGCPAVQDASRQRQENSPQMCSYSLEGGRFCPHLLRPNYL